MKKISFIASLMMVLVVTNVSAVQQVRLPFTSVMIDDPEKGRVAYEQVGGWDKTVQVNDDFSISVGSLKRQIQGFIKQKWPNIGITNVRIDIVDVDTGDDGTIIRRLNLVPQIWFYADIL